MPVRFSSRSKGCGGCSSSSHTFPGRMSSAVIYNVDILFFAPAGSSVPRRRVLGTGGLTSSPQDSESGRAMGCSQASTSSSPGFGSVRSSASGTLVAGGLAGKDLFSLRSNGSLLALVGSSASQAGSSSVSGQVIREILSYRQHAVAVMRFSLDEVAAVALH